MPQHEYVISLSLSALLLLQIQLRSLRTLVYDVNVVSGDPNAFSLPHPKLRRPADGTRHFISASRIFMQPREMPLITETRRALVLSLSPLPIYIYIRCGMHFALDLSLEPAELDLSSSFLLYFVTREKDHEYQPLPRFTS